MNNVDLIELRRENLKQWFETRTMPTKDKSFISQIINGKATIGERAARRLEQENGMKMNYLDTDHSLVLEENRDELIIIDVLNVEASAGHGSLGDLVKTVRQLRYFPEQFYSLFRGLNPDVIQVINVKGDSMSPTFAPGDLAFVDVSIQYFDGDGVYVFNYGDSLYLKRLQKAGNEFIVISDNETYREWRISADHADELFIHGKVKVHQSQRLNFIG